MMYWMGIELQLKCCFNRISAPNWQQRPTPTASRRCINQINSLSSNRQAVPVLKVLNAMTSVYLVYTI